MTRARSTTIRPCQFNPGLRRWGHWKDHLTPEQGAEYQLSLQVEGTDTECSKSILLLEARVVRGTFCRPLAGAGLTARYHGPRLEAVDFNGQKISFRPN
jgi:hypothetical protein